MPEEGLSPEQLQVILPDDWVPASAIPRRKPKPRSLVKINKTCISIPEVVHQRMGRPLGLTFFFHDYDLIMIPANDYSIEDRGTGLFLVHLRRLESMFQLGEYEATRDSHFSGLKAIRLKGALTFHSRDFKPKRNPRTERRLAAT